MGYKIWSVMQENKKSLSTPN